MPSSKPRKSAMRFSSSLWISWVPQMKRTEDMPKPRSSRLRRAASTTAGSSESPR